MSYYRCTDGTRITPEEMIERVRALGFDDQDDDVPVPVRSARRGRAGRGAVGAQGRRRARVLPRLLVFRLHPRGVRAEGRSRGPVMSGLIEHADARDFLACQAHGSASAIIFDPPYSRNRPPRNREDGAAGHVWGPFGFMADVMAACHRVLRPCGDRAKGERGGRDRLRVLRRGTDAGHGLDRAQVGPEVRRVRGVAAQQRRQRRRLPRRVEPGHAVFPQLARPRLQGQRQELDPGRLPGRPRAPVRQAPGPAGVPPCPRLPARGHGPGPRSRAAAPAGRRPRT